MQTTPCTIDCDLTCDLETINRTLAAILNDDPDNAFSLVEMQPLTLPWDRATKVNDCLQLKLFADVAESTFWLLCGDGAAPSPLIDGSAEGTIDAASSKFRHVLHARFAPDENEMCRCDVDLDRTERIVPRF